MAYIKIHEFQEYFINEHGHIINSIGTTINGCANYEGKRIVRLRNRHFIIAWLVMKYHGGIVANKNETVRHKDNDYMNCSLSNLYIEPKQTKSNEGGFKPKDDTWMNGTAEIYC
jgi:hypothetical protein